MKVEEKIQNRIKKSRMSFEKLGENYDKAEDIVIEGELIARIKCYWFYKKEWKRRQRVIIYLHGGCFVLGSIHSHSSLVSHLANELDTPILFIEYSLAPENPFPSAMSEILNVYEYLIYKKHLDDIIIIGDSAGAGLAVSVISRLNKKNFTKPRRLVLLSPWVDLRVQNESITANEGVDSVLSKEELKFYASLYIGEGNLPDANPTEMISGDFPPTLILTGANEILLDDSKILHSKISESQPQVSLKIYERQTHVWLLDDIESETSKKGIEEIRKFLDDES